ncbi:MAG: ATP-dependent helicase [Candidatus Acidiferrales bacterium]
MASRLVDLSPQQRAAVEHLHGPLLVIAGAGTGKTRVITERVTYLLETIPELEGENLLAITFTIKAAEEMQARIRRAGDKRAERVGVYTFHAFCYDLLQRHQQALKILDPVDYWIFLRRRLDRLGLNLFLRLSEPGRFLTNFIEFFSRCQDELVSPEDYAAQHVDKLAARFEEEKRRLGEDERGKRAEELARQQELVRAYAVAEQLLAEAQRTTFGSSQFSAVQLLRSHPELLSHYQERYRYILVDEFQDANIAQIELLALLAGRHRNLTAVGDDDQAIYRFRGASYASFKKFESLFPDGRRITLAQNYRSTARILSVATTLIAQNGPARADPNKRLLPRAPGGEKVRLAEVHDAAEEAAHVRSAIELLRGKTGTYAGIAVLYRAHLHRNALVEELQRARIPFAIRGLSILTSPLVRDLLAYLRVIQNPRDNVSWARLLAIPAWGFTRDLFLDLLRRLTRQQPSLAQAIADLHPRVRDEQTRLGELARLLADFRRRGAALPLSELFDLLLERLGIQLLPSDPERPYFETFVRFVRQWQAEKSDTQTLSEFIQYFDYFQEAGGKIDLPEESLNPDVVQLMTVHAAKGLEFDSVFVLRLNRGDFPSRPRSPLFEFPEELMKEELPVGDFQIQEERRLCYVALTRARERLALSTLTAPRKQPSVFLEDILRDAHAARDIEPVRPAPPPPASPPPSQAGQQTLFPSAATFSSRMAAWAGQPVDSFIQEPLTLSHSALETYRQCPLKYQFAHLWRLPGLHTPAMLFGQIMHRSVVEFFRARQRLPEVSAEEAQHIYEQQWRETAWPFQDTFQQELYRSAGLQQLQEFRQQTTADPPSVLELEKTFRWTWEDVVLTGRIDQINRISGRAVEIVEYKTGQPRPPEKVEKSVQLALYALAARHELGFEPARLTLYNFTLNQGHSFAPVEKTLERAQESLREVAEGIRAGAFPPQPGYHCRYCDYRLLCPAFEQSLGAPAEEPESAAEGREN